LKLGSCPWTIEKAFSLFEILVTGALVQRPIILVFQIGNPLPMFFLQFLKLHHLGLAHIHYVLERVEHGLVLFFEVVDVVHACADVLDKS
jgi:hypothetical protein